jgi:3'(2'), 5'-bisphosphate nucleotidase
VVGGRVVVAALACPNLGMHKNDGSAGTGDGGSIFYAVEGQGSFAVRAVSVFGQSGVAPVRLAVSLTDDPAACRFCESVESGHSAHNDAAAIASRLGMTTEGVRLDSQAKYGVVARGEADAYLRLPTSSTYREKIWDHAAGALIVTEAGGLVTDIRGRALEFDHGRELMANRGVIVSNRRLHPAILDAVRSVLTINVE